MQTPVPAAVVALLREPNPSVISTTRPDGSPASSAVWYLWDDGWVLTSMSATSPRVRNLRANPQVSLTVLDASDWYRQVTLRGTVESLEPDTDCSVIDRIARQYTGADYEDHVHAHTTARIRVDSWDQYGLELP